MGLGALAVLEPDAAQLSPGPRVEALQVALAAGIAEVGHPSRKEAVELRDHARQANAPIALGDLADPLLHAGEARRRDAE